MTHCIIQTQLWKTKKIKSLKHSKTVCTIQEWCTANGVEKKQDELKNKFLNEKNQYYWVIVNFIVCLFVKWNLTTKTR